MHARVSKRYKHCLANLHTKIVKQNFGSTSVTYKIYFPCQGIFTY